MLIIADSSALISLASCKKLSLLDKLFADVKVPQAVFDEVTQKEKSQSEILRDYLKGKVVDIDLTNLVLDFGELGRGELEAMALFKQINADLLLLDDKKARKIALLNKIPIVGSFGILLSGKKKGLIKSVKPLIDELELSGIYISKSLVKRVLILAKEDSPT
jgi:uncharacterized protein